MKIITISGLDGSGKSTQIQLLKDYLESQGKRVFYFHTIEFGIARKINNLKNYCLICRLLGKCKAKKENTNDLLLSQDFVGNNKSEKSVVKANKFQIWLRKIFFKIDLSRFRKLVARLEKGGYDYLISDRYFYDSVVNIEYLSNLKLGFRKFLKPSFRKPDLAIYLQTTPEIIMQRERKPDQGLEYLQKKKEIYDKYSEIWNLRKIDGSKSKEEIFEEIKKDIVTNIS
jgi:thymidylate kinase